MAPIEMTPPTGERLVRFVGDWLLFTLRIPGGLPAGGRALLRTNIGKAVTLRREIIASHAGKRPLSVSFWRDVPMRPVAGTAELFEISLPLAEVGFFRAKAYWVDERGWQHWPDGEDFGLSVHPNSTRTANTIYCAFTRMFGDVQKATRTRDDALEARLRKMEDEGYSVIPKSGTFRDLKKELPHIFDTLGCRILHLLPVNPTPTVFAKMGRFGSPYAAQDLVAVDPALVEFDNRTNAVDQFIELADAVHQRDGRLFIDIVINHTGWGSTLWNEHPEWFMREPNGNFASPSAWGTVWGDLVELEPHHIELWEQLAEAFLIWCRRGVDGFRCDAGYKVPLPVWQYIVARVREEFPDTVFLLEGLGGAWTLTEALLTEGGMQWAYSELFQEFSGTQIGGYLGHALKQSGRVGALVHYSETHDNLRLAAKGRDWSLMRNRLSALTSVCGGYGFTCGVEWLADEKVEVHQRRGLNWGAPVNITAELATLNQVLVDHPAFFDGTSFTRLSPPGSPIYALRRDSADGCDSVLVLVNTDPEAEHALGLAAGDLGFLGRDPVSLLSAGDSSTPPPVMHRDADGATVLIQLRPASVICLAPGRVPIGPGGADYRRIRAQAALAAQAMAAVLVPEAMPQWSAAELAAAIHSDGAGFLTVVSRLSVERPSEDLATTMAKSSSSYPNVVSWMPIDVRRVTPVPPRHWILLKDTVPFRATVSAVGSAKAPLHLESVPVLNGHIAVVPSTWWADARVEPSGDHGAITATVSMIRFSATVERIKASLLLLTDRPTFSGDFDVASPAAQSAMVLLTNGRGGMSRMAIDLGRVFSKYDCLLGANLHPELPVDRHVFAKRLRAWINVDGFITPLNLQNLAAFRPGPPAVWTFRAYAGDERTVDVRLSAEMPDRQNAVVLRFSRPSGGVGGPSYVRVTVRVDLEDRSFHSQTERNEGSEHHFRSHTHAMANASGFAFTPTADRRLHVVAGVGQFYPGEEWSTCGHPIEATRGQVGQGDAFSPGWFELPVETIGETTLLISAGEAEAGGAALPRGLEHGGAAAPPDQMADSFAAQLGIAAKAFVAKRGRGKTVIAGYPWFLDWGRDSLIAARGLLAGGQFEAVRDLLVTFGRFVENGTLPNTIHGDNASNRDTSDAPLWFGIVAEDLAEDIRRRDGAAAVTAFYQSKIDDRGRSLADVLRDIAAGYIAGTPNGIRVDAASCLVWSPSHFTWMDTNYPAGTPREGYPIEIQALWIRMLSQLDRIGCAPVVERWAVLAERARVNVERLYWLEKKGWFADCLNGVSGMSADHCVRDEVLRSNMLFLVSLGLVKGERARRSVEAARRWLVIPGALRSLAPLPATPVRAVYGNGGQLLNDPGFPYWGRYEGDEDTRRKPAYHNGTGWGWTLPTFCEALAVAYANSPEAVAAAKAYLASSAERLKEGCLGQLPENTDGDAPHIQRGCDAQAWSVTEALRVWKVLKG